MPTSAASTPKKLFPKDWLEIVVHAENGMKVAQIAKIYDVDESVIYKGLKRRKVNIGAAALRAAAIENERHREDLIKKIKETKEADYKFTEALQKIVMRHIMDAQKTTISGAAAPGIASVMDDIKTLKIAMDAIRGGTDNKFRILGIEKENGDADKILPELPISILTDEETQMIRDRQVQEDGGDGVDPELEGMLTEDDAEIVDEDGDA